LEQGEQLRRLGSHGKGGSACLERLVPSLQRDERERSAIMPLDERLTPQFDGVARRGEGCLVEAECGQSGRVVAVQEVQPLWLLAAILLVKLKSAAEAVGGCYEVFPLKRLPRQGRLGLGLLPKRRREAVAGHLVQI
jgi:hypothetical protein